MRRGQDISVKFPGLYLVHHNLPEKHLERHAHGEAILFIPLQGEIHLKLDDRVLGCGPGRMIFLPGGLYHAFDGAGQTAQGERLIALIDPKLCKKAGLRGATPGLLPMNQLCKELLFHLLLQPRSRLAPALVETFVGILAESLEGAGEAEAGLDHLEGRIVDPRLRRAVEKVREDFASALSMHALARGSGLSTRSLNRLFLTELGMGPKQLQTRLRVRRAETLLLEGKAVTEVAYDVGYQSLSQFISVFRQTTGRLPSDVRRHK